MAAAFLYYQMLHEALVVSNHKETARLGQQYYNTTQICGIGLQLALYNHDGVKSASNKWSTPSITPSAQG